MAIYSAIKGMELSCALTAQLLIYWQGVNLNSCKLLA